MTPSEVVKQMQQSDLMKKAKYAVSAGFDFFQFKLDEASYLINFKNPNWVVYQVKKHLGSGDNGSVSQAINLNTDTEVAIKSSWLRYDCVEYGIEKLKADACNGAKLAK